MELKELIQLRHDLLLLAREFADDPEFIIQLAEDMFSWCTMGTVKVEKIREVNSDPESN